jgi:HAMP domain-containing protein
LFIFLVNFLSFLLHCLFVRALGTDTLFAKFWLEGRLERLSNVCGC